jgi:hypothetical protein
MAQSTITARERVVTTRRVRSEAATRAFALRQGPRHSRVARLLGSRAVARADAHRISCTVPCGQGSQRVMAASLEDLQAAGHLAKMSQLTQYQYMDILSWDERVV